MAVQLDQAQMKGPLSPLKLISMKIKGYIRVAIAMEWNRQDKKNRTSNGSVARHDERLPA